MEDEGCTPTFLLIFPLHWFLFQDSALIKQILPRLDAVCDSLNSWLDLTTLQGVRDKDAATLSRCCRIYATIDRIEAAEALIKLEVVRPHVETCLEQAEKIDSSNLGQIYNNLLKIIPEHLAELVKLTTDEKKTVEGSVNGFDFLVNSFWTEVGEKLLQDIGNISNPGNPGEFFRNYEISMKFLNDFETNLTSEESLNHLRNLESYNSFLQSWNMPVYFQIRFQEIATPYETLLNHTKLALADNNTGCCLKVTEEAKIAISRCFDQDIFLRTLANRFFKLSLQIISRYQVWALMCLKVFKDGPELEPVTQDIKRSETTKDLQKLDGGKKSMKKSVSDQQLDKPSPTLMISLSDIVHIFCDTEHLIAAAPTIITSGLKTVLADSGGLNLDLAVHSGVEVLSSVLPTLSAAISAHMVAGPAKMVKSVGDIPRMYRRTNRELPSKPCSYITNIVEELKSFHVSLKEKCSLTILSSWLGHGCNTILELYLVQVQDVLSNVTKMEESLKKLKKVREKNNGVTGKDKAGGLSDDDKIRLQLYLDVMYLLREMGKEELGKLETVVEGESGKRIKHVVEQAVSSFISDIDL